MIVFITNNPSYKKKFEGKYKVLDSLQGKVALLDFIKGKSDVAFDIETTGLDAYLASPLFYIIGNEEIQFVIHKPYVESFKDIFSYIKDNNIRFIGHNIKFDIKFIKTNEDVFITNVYDTMIAEQRLWQKLDISKSLEATIKRYLKVEESEIDKRIRKEFIGVNPKSFIVEERHVNYAVGDVNKLLAIKEIQDKKIYQNMMNNLIYKIEMPLVSIIANAELRGFRFDKEGWLKLFNDNILKRFDIELKLDEEFRRLRDKAITELGLNEEQILRCKGGKFDHPRTRSKLLDYFDIDGSPKGVDLFGNPLTTAQVTGIKKKPVLYPNNINYQSDKQVIELFAHLQQDVLTKYKDYSVPEFIKGKVQSIGYTVSEKAFDKYLTDFPNTEMKDFIKLLLEHRKLSVRINTFGKSFIDNLNPVTGNLHTVFRQAAATTSRFQSGGGHKEPDKPNFQNIPRAKEYRKCFIARDGYQIVTSDYSGAELIVMCSLAQDMNLLEISKGDMHSYVATKCWKAIYKYRRTVAEKALASKNSTISWGELQKLIDKNKKLEEEFIVDKSESKEHLRTAFKPVTFGVIYGLRAKALAENLSISVEEAQVVIDTIRRMFPAVFKMVEQAAEFAMKHGWILINNRTNSKAYFPNIIRYLKGEYTMDIHAGEIFKDANEARNIRIQGTQADFMKEATVRLQRFIDKNCIDANILSWVHDEIVTEVHNDYIETKNLSYTSFKGKKYINLDFAEAKRLIMNDTANQYLNNVTIDAEYFVEKHWIK